MKGCEAVRVGVHLSVKKKAIRAPTPYPTTTGLFSEDSNCTVMLAHHRRIAFHHCVCADDGKLVEVLCVTGCSASFGAHPGDRCSDKTQGRNLVKPSLADKCFCAHLVLHLGQKFVEIKLLRLHSNGAACWACMHSRIQ